MAEGGDDGQEKTEDPSQKRLDKAKEDGEVLSSKELQVFMTMSMGVALIYALYVFLPPRMGHWIAFFEFGDLSILAESIRKHGQIEPVYVRALQDHPKFKYEVLAGSRRWKACLNEDLTMKAIVNNVSDFVSE